jgi:hypothetical protein
VGFRILHGSVDEEDDRVVRTGKVKSYSCGVKGKGWWRIAGLFCCGQSKENRCWKDFFSSTIRNIVIRYTLSVVVHLESLPDYISVAVHNLNHCC